MTKKLVVIGGGESGVGAALLGKKSGFEVFLSDAGTLAEKYKQELIEENISFEEGRHTFEKLSFADVVVKSPGIPDEAEVIRQITSEGMKAISEIEFGYRFYDGKILAITGSNGKTTASGLLYHVMKRAGVSVELGGNYGKSFCRILTEGHPEYMVLEISSFQLDGCYEFAPHVGAILNITIDHLDRYDMDFDKYRASKYRIAQAMTPAQILIVNGDDEGIRGGLAQIPSGVNVVSIGSDDYIHGILSKEGKPFDLTIRGIHNLLNARIVVEMLRCSGISEAEIADGLSSFVNLPHRMEKVAEIEGVAYINDSKATNVDAAFYALSAYEQDVIWIAGGTDKGNDYTVLDDVCRGRVAALVCLGADNTKLKAHFQGIVPIVVETQNMEKAVAMATTYAQNGGTVLLSPACASFDLFKNYIDRGDQFRAAVKKMEATQRKV